MLPGPSRSYPILATGLTLVALAASARAGVPLFVDATEEMGLGGSHASGGLYGPGVSCVDFDLDGDLDLFVCDDTNGNRLYRNDGGVLRDVAPELGLNWRPAAVTIPGHPDVVDVTSMMPCIVDADNDGDRDLFLTVWNLPNMFWRNDGAGGYVEEASIMALDIVGRSAGAAFGDYNRDGFLDVYVADWGELDHLFRSAGGNAFRDVSDAAGLWQGPVPARAGWGAVWHYRDGDLDPELYVANDFSLPNFHYWNLGNGTFIETASDWYEADHNRGASMGIAFGDYDHDGDEDLYVTNALTQLNDFYQRRPNRYVNLMLTGDPGTRVLKDTRVGWHCEWPDVDNDGWQDLYLVNGYIPTCPPNLPEFPHECSTPSVFDQPNRLWQNAGGGSFVDVSVSSGLDDSNFGRAAAVSDFDLDGDLDIYLTNNNGPYRYMRNESEGVGHWLTVRLRGKGSGTDAIGARIFATVGEYTHRRTHYGLSGYLSQPGDDIHVGVGEATTIDELRVRWPRSGREDAVRDVPADRVITLEEGFSNARVAPLAFPVLDAAVAFDRVELNVQIPEGEGFEEFVVHRAEMGRWSGVVHRGAVNGPSVAWTDHDVGAGKSYRYRVFAVAEDIELSTASAVVTLPEILPREPVLAAGYPNPFNPEVSLPIEILGRSPRHVDLAVYDVAGRRLRTLYNGPRSPGHWEPTFDGRDDRNASLPSGIYYVRLVVDGFDTVARKITLLR